MSRTSRVLDDSEDDEEDLVEWHRDIDTSAQELHASTAKHGTNSIDGLKQQIRTAEADMASTAFATVTTLPASTARSNLKRSRTDVVASIASSEQTGRLKRVKSSKESPRDSSRLLPRERTPGDIFSEHSQTDTSPFAPTGSIAEGFLAHEPFTLFGQSGSTVPDNTATQQRVRDLASRPSETAIRSMIESDDQLHLRSSSVLFSASQLYNTSQAPVKETDTAVDAVDAPTQDGLPAISTPLQAVVPSQASTGSCIEVTAVSTTRTGKLREDVREPGKPAADKLSSSQAALIGLPAEQYKPRPSKRRVTQLPDLPVDYIADPEKAARTQRSKSSATTSKNGKSRPATKKSKSTTAVVVIDDTTPDQVKGSADLMPVTMAEAVSTGEAVQQGPVTTTNDRDELAPSQHQTEDVASEEAFAKPARPQGKKKMGKASKRSHTTIFEDHVDLPVKSQRPTLTQQQADRKAILADADKNASKGKVKRGQTKIVDDEEDELAIPMKPVTSSLPKPTVDEQAVAVDVIVQEPNSNDKVAIIVEPTPREPSPSPPRPCMAPSPEPTSAILKSTTVTTLPNDPPSSSPTHSPLKSSAVPHRVGLSKRHRIPSLLKIVRPLKKT